MMISSSGLGQAGGEGEGLRGFLPTDIARWNTNCLDDIAKWNTAIMMITRIIIITMIVMMVRHFWGLPAQKLETFYLLKKKTLLRVCTRTVSTIVGYQSHFDTPVQCLLRHLSQFCQTIEFYWGKYSLICRSVSLEQTWIFIMSTQLLIIMY